MYGNSLHVQPVFKGTKYYPHNESWIVSEKVFTNGICLPSVSNMIEEEQNKVIDEAI